MNRRNFFASLAKAAAGFTILPAATTYERIWRVQRPEFVIVDSYYLRNIEWYNLLPYWYAVNYAAKDVELTRIFWEKWHDRLRSAFPPNLGEVISPAPNKLTTNNYAQLQNPIHKVTSAR